MTTKRSDFETGLIRARKAYGAAHGHKKYSRQQFQEDFNNVMGWAPSISIIIKWETKNVIPQLETIDKLCEFFDCDLDYLFNRTDIKKHSVQDIMEYTGLSEDSVIALHRIKDISAYDSARETISFLIDESYRSRDDAYCGPLLLRNIDTYLHSPKNNDSYFQFDGSGGMFCQTPYTKDPVILSPPQNANRIYAFEMDKLIEQILQQQINNSLHDAKMIFKDGEKDGIK